MISSALSISLSQHCVIWAGEMFKSFSRWDKPSLSLHCCITSSSIIFRLKQAQSIITIKVLSSTHNQYCKKKKDVMWLVTSCTSISEFIYLLRTKLLYDQQTVTVVSAKMIYSTCTNTLVNRILIPETLTEFSILTLTTERTPTEYCCNMNLKL